MNIQVHNQGLRLTGSDLLCLNQTISCMPIKYAYNTHMNVSARRGLSHHLFPSLPMCVMCITLVGLPMEIFAIRFLLHIKKFDHLCFNHLKPTLSLNHASMCLMVLCQIASYLLQSVRTFH